MEDHVIFCETPEDVADAAAELIFDKQTEAVADRGVFRIALSGGSTPKLLYERLASEEWREEMSWDRWEVFWSDERAVPRDHPESNYRLAHSAFLSKAPVRNVFRMFPLESSPLSLRGGERGRGIEVEQAARQYATMLKQQFSSDLPVFDVILLGLGSDGHTASLFPNHPALESEKLVEAVAPGSSLTPGPSSLPRLTLTYRVLNAARTIIFLICGEEKGNAVQSVLEFGDPSLPATHVKPENGECFWILDAAAAHLLE